jgi:hypothetical protein
LSAKSQELAVTESKKLLRQIGAYVYRLDIETDKIILRKGMENIYVSISLKDYLRKIIVSLYEGVLEDKEDIMKFIFNRKQFTKQQLNDIREYYRNQQIKVSR